MGAWLARPPPSSASHRDTSRTSAPPSLPALGQVLLDFERGEDGRVTIMATCKSSLAEATPHPNPTQNTAHASYFAPFCTAPSSPFLSAHPLGILCVPTGRFGAPIVSFAAASNADADGSGSRARCAMATYIPSSRLPRPAPIPRLLLPFVVVLLSCFCFSSYT